MFLTSAPRPRGRIGLHAALLTMVFLAAGGAFSPTWAQGDTKKAGGPAAAPAAAKGAAAAPAAAKGEAAAPSPDEDAAADSDKEDKEEHASAATEGLVETTKAQRSQLEERFKDPRAEAALANTFPELFANTRQNESSTRLISAMAKKEGSLDPRSLPEYVKAQIAQLTKKANIEALSKSEAVPGGAKAIEQAGANLINPVLLATQIDNTAFRTEYTKALLGVARDVAKNHLYARTMFMVAVSKSQDPLAVPFLIAQLNDQEQPASIKLLAAIGLTNVTKGGKVDLNPGDDTKAARAVCNFLENEPAAFWPVQARALQALGSIRQASSDRQAPKADYAAVALKFLSDPQAHPSVRAWACWALGMIRPTPALADYNFRLIVQQAGLAALDIGYRVQGDDFDPKVPAQVALYQERARRLGDSLIQMVYGLEGDPAVGVRNSGLAHMDHPALSAQRREIDPILPLIKDVAKAVVEVSLAIPTKIAEPRKELEKATSALAAGLDAKPPTELSLVPGGAEFPLPKVTPPPPPAEKPKPSAAAKVAKTGESEKASTKSK